VEKVNRKQRVPYESKEIAKGTAEFAILTSIIQDLMDFIRANVSMP
jgi:hypothetical protein